MSWLESPPASPQPGDQHAGTTLQPGKLRLRHSAKGRRDSCINEPVLETSHRDPFSLNRERNRMDENES